MDEDFEVIGKIESIETIAVGPSIRELHRLRKAFGHGRWRKLKGIATVDCKMVQFAVQKFTGTKRTASVARS